MPLLIRLDFQNNAIDNEKSNITVMDESIKYLRAMPQLCSNLEWFVLMDLQNQPSSH